MSDAQSHGQTQTSLTALTLGAIGVVYGDIGTSVLYSIKEVFGSGHVAFTPDNVYGILSIFFWTLTMIVSVKYVSLVLRADKAGASLRTLVSTALEPFAKGASVSIEGPELIAPSLQDYEQRAIELAFPHKASHLLFVARRPL